MFYQEMTAQIANVYFRVVLEDKTYFIQLMQPVANEAEEWKTVDMTDNEPWAEKKFFAAVSRHVNAAYNSKR